MINMQFFTPEFDKEVDVPARCAYCGLEHHILIKPIVQDDQTVRIELTVRDHTADLLPPTDSIIE